MTGEVEARRLHPAGTGIADALDKLTTEFQSVHIMHLGTDLGEFSWSVFTERPQPGADPTRDRVLANWVDGSARIRRGRLSVFARGATRGDAAAAAVRLAEAADAVLSAADLTPVDPGLEAEG